MTLSQAVSERHSCRTYTGEPLAANQTEALSAQIAGYNETEGLSMRVVEDASAAFHGFKSYGMFKGVRTVIQLACGTRDPHGKEKLGYYGELTVLTATAMGLGTCWVAGSYGRKDDAFQCAEGFETACVLAVGFCYGAGQRPSP